MECSECKAKPKVLFRVFELFEKSEATYCRIACVFTAKIEFDCLLRT
jgi:hypothetical protein